MGSILCWRLMTCARNNFFSIGIFQRCLPHTSPSPLNSCTDSLFNRSTGSLSIIKRQSRNGDCTQDVWIFKLIDVIRRNLRCSFDGNHRRQIRDSQDNSYTQCPKSKHAHSVSHRTVRTKDLNCKTPLLKPISTEALQF